MKPELSYGVVIITLRICLPGAESSMGAQTSLMSADRQEKAEEIEKSMVARFRDEYLAEYRAQVIAVRTANPRC